MACLIPVLHAAMLLKEVLGVNVKLVSGFKGTAEIRFAMSPVKSAA